MNVLISILDIPLAQYVYVSQVFHYVPLFVSLPAAWMFDKHGSRLGIFVCLALVAPRSCARALLMAPHVANWRQAAYYYWLIQFLFAYLTFPIYYCLPLKLSEEWFPANERSFAWALVLVAPDLGSAIAALTTPRFVDTKDLEHTLQPMSYTILASYAISVLAICCTISRSQPREGAPSERNQQSVGRRKRAAPMLSDALEREQSNSSSIGGQLAKWARNRHLLVQQLTLTSFDALNWAVSTVQQDILASAQMSQVFAGQFMALMYIFSSCIRLFGALRMKPAADLRDFAQSNPPPESIESSLAEQEVFKTNRSKLLFGLQCFAYLLYCLALILQELHHLLPGLERCPLYTMLINHQAALVIGCCLVYTLIRNWATSTFNEQCAQLISGSVSEATQSALNCALACVFTNTFLVAFVSLKQERQSAGSKETSSNYTRPVLFVCALALLMASIFMFCFNPRLSTVGLKVSSRNGSARGEQEEEEGGGGDLEGLEDEQRSISTTTTTINFK